MTWRIQVTHRSGYRYRGEVTSSYNEARITPLSTHRQMVLDPAVTVAPRASVYRYWDYWGTLVDAFEVHEPHAELAVTGSSLVETMRPWTRHRPSAGTSSPDRRCTTSSPSCSPGPPTRPSRRRWPTRPDP